MNKDNAAQYLPLVQALAGGRVIRARNSGYPVEMDEVNFSLPPECYDIKPEPREWWQLRDANCVRAEFTSRELADRYANGIPGNVWAVVHVREVTQ